MTCPGCGETLVVGSWPWCRDGHAPSVPHIIDDTIAGGPRFFDTLGHTDVWIESKSQLRREVSARGLVPFERHVGQQGSDKSDHTSRWV